MRGVLLLLLATASTVAADAQRNTTCHDREATSSSVVIASEDEPGVRIVISGRVLAGDDREPVAGARVLAFHTDSRGYYSPGGMDEQNARLCGVLLTDSEGRYRIDTIKPAHYATGGGPPAHVHFEVTLPETEGRPSVARFTLNFEGDPRLGGRTGDERWDRIRPIDPQPDGTGHVERDLWVR